MNWGRGKNKQQQPGYEQTRDKGHGCKRVRMHMCRQPLGAPAKAMPWGQQASTLAKRLPSSPLAPVARESLLASRALTASDGTFVPSAGTD